MVLRSSHQPHHKGEDIFLWNEYGFYLFPESPEVNVGGIEYIWVRGRAGWEGSLDKGRNQRHLRSRKGKVEAYQMDGWEVVDTERGVEL